MTHHTSTRTTSTRTRVAALTAAALLGLGLATLFAAPAQARAAVGYVRLAHLSPDTPEVDVYLSKVGDNSFDPQVFRGVGYGVMSKYLALPVGTYAVAMRQKGAAASTPPVLTTQVTVEDGGAYTVAGTGKFADLGLTILDDDLSRPDGGKAKVRVIQASVAAPVLDVSLANGTPIADGVTFASTTTYNIVSPGTWTLKLTPTGSSSASTAACTLAAGSVYSLLVLDGPHGLTTELRIDARGPGTAPDGGVETGAGGAAPTDGVVDPLLTIGAGLIVLIGLLALALRMRRLANQRT